MGNDGKALERAYSEPLLADARPCPFCKGETLGMFPGSSSSSIMSGDTMRVVCPQCLGQGPIGETALRAVAKWNGDFTPIHRKDLSS